MMVRCLGLDKVYLRDDVDVGVGAGRKDTSMRLVSGRTVQKRTGFHTVQLHNEEPP